VRLRTEKGEIVDPESELGGTSDTEGENQRFRVRSWWNFRHRKGKSAVQSQNPDQLRTQKEKMGGLESEPGSTSDTKRENERFRVRTRVDFGHKKRK
jgi:hypothetical protein